MSVKSYIKKYLTESLNTEIIKPERGSTLLSIIKPHLILVSAMEKEEEIPAGYEEIQIELPDLRQVYEASSGKVYYCETLFRNRIDSIGLAKVRTFFTRTFKAAFHTFMDGYIEYQNEFKSKEEGLVVKQGVCSFLNQYHITYDNKLADNLTRDWYRHRDRNEKNRFSPVLY